MRLAVAGALAGLFIAAAAAGAEARVPDGLRSADLNAAMCAGLQDRYDADALVVNDTSISASERYLAGQSQAKSAAEWDRACSARFGSIAPRSSFAPSSAGPATSKLPSSSNGVATIYLH
jgi:hypothetical protein